MTLFGVHCQPSKCLNIASQRVRALSCGAACSFACSQESTLVPKSWCGPRVGPRVVSMEGGGGGAENDVNHLDGLAVEGGGGGGAENGVNHFDRLPEGAWDEIFRRLPHLSRLHSRCVCSKWNRFLRPLQQHLRCLSSRRPASGLAMFMADDGERVEGWMFAPEETDAGTRLEVEFPPGWTPEANAGGFRSGDLAAFFLEGRYWVGNPVHNKWEKVPESVLHNRSLQFDKRRFELVVDEDGCHYNIVQFRFNESRGGVQVSYFRGNEWVTEGENVNPTPAREVDNWVMEVYSSRTRMWRAGPAMNRPVFRQLCDFCVSDRTVYFLGWASIIPHPGGDLRILERFNSVVVWGYDLDSDTLAEVLPAADYRGGKEFSGLGPVQLHLTYPSSMRLHVSKQPGQAEQRLEFSITQVTFVTRSDEVYPTDKLFRLLLDQRSPLEGRFWYVEGMVDIDQLTEGGPEADFVADTWGLNFVAYYHYNEDTGLPGPPSTMSMLLHERDDQKWVRWEVPGTGTTSIHLQDVPAVSAFLPCECFQW